MITDIAHVCIAAPDLEAAERFYCGALGMRRVFNFLRGGKRIGFYLDVGNGRFIEVFQRKDVEAGERHPLVHICLLVDDMDRVRERLVGHGVDVTAKKMGADRSWQMWATDPGGVRIEFHQYTAGSSQVTGADCVLE